MEFAKADQFGGVLFFRAFSGLGFEHRPLVILVICGSCMHFGRSFLG